MKKFTARAAVFLILAATGLAFAVYSFRIKNSVLLVVSALFAVVSADNIFCSLK